MKVFTDAITIKAISFLAHHLSCRAYTWKFAKAETHCSLQVTASSLLNLYLQQNKQQIHCMVCMVYANPMRTEHPDTRSCTLAELDLPFVFDNTTAAVWDVAAKDALSPVVSYCCHSELIRSQMFPFRLSV